MRNLTKKELQKDLDKYRELKEKLYKFTKHLVKKYKINNEIQIESELELKFYEVDK